MYVLIHVYYYESNVYAHVLVRVLAKVYYEKYNLTPLVLATTYFRTYVRTYIRELVVWRIRRQQSSTSQHCGAQY